MNIQQIKYIVALDRLRNFARAAEACDVSQPTLSAMVQKLEEELDVRICCVAHGSWLVPKTIGGCLTSALQRQSRSSMDG